MGQLLQNATFITNCDSAVINKKENKHTLNINNSHITSEDSVVLLGVESDKSKTLKSIIQHDIGKKEKEIIINSFVYSYFMYFHLYDIFGDYVLLHLRCLKL